jgi:hypothetical protein
MDKSTKLLTSVNVNRTNHLEFKMLCIKNGITFQKLVNTAVEMYLEDTEFRKIINNKK